MENNEHLSEEEKLKVENDFLKMKIMLEHGTGFYVPAEENEPLSAELLVHYKCADRRYRIIMNNKFV